METIKLSSVIRFPLFLVAYLRAPKDSSQSSSTVQSFKKNKILLPKFNLKFSLLQNFKLNKKKIKDLEASME